MDTNNKFIKEPLDRICNNNELTYNELYQNIKSLPEKVIPYTLEEWGIPKSQLKKLASESFTKGRMENNIVDLSEKDVISILESIF